MKINNKERVQILNSPVDKLSFKETIELIENAIISRKSLQHVCVNAGKIVKMQNDKVLCKAVVEADIISADGQAIVWASKFLGDPLPERVNGTNLMEALIKLAYEKDFKCFFFGAKEEVVNKVVYHYSNLYSKYVVAGFRNGYYSEDEELLIAKEISNCKADILFVAITSPKKELFLNKYKNIINTSFIMGVGGSFDVIAGVTKRAPIWMQKKGLEWLYRFIQEPRRLWKRYLIGNLKFIYLVLLQKMDLYKYE